MKLRYELVNGIDQFLERVSPIKSFLQEELYMKDLNTAVSNLTNKHLELRVNDPSKQSGIDVLEATWAGEKFQIYFYTSPSASDGPTQVMTPSGQQYPGTFYNVSFEFDDATKIMGDKTAFQGRTLDEKVQILKNYIRLAPVRVYSNDPSFWYQGMFEDLEAYDGNIYPYKGPKGDGVWRDRHVSSGGLAKPPLRITKHMGQIMQVFDSYIKDIVAKLK